MHNDHRVIIIQGVLKTLLLLEFVKWKTEFYFYVLKIQFKGLISWY